MRFIYSAITIFCLTLVGACGGGGGGSKPEVTNYDDLITGHWEYAYEDIQCVETYSFFEDGTFKAISLNEIQSGTYSLAPVQGVPGRYRLNYNIDTDNGLVSCSGSDQNDSGLETFMFIEFPDLATLEVYESAVSPQPVGFFTLASNEVDH